MIDLNGQLELFNLIGNELEDSSEAYLIGGSAMMVYGLKAVTKDIDIVFLGEKDHTRFINALKKLGFKKREFEMNDKYRELDKTIPVVMELDNARIDVFFRRIICFDMSETMISRITQKIEFSNLIVKVVTPEDIILLKCATDRKGDRIDAHNIIKAANVNWDIIIAESISQTTPKSHIFPVFLYDFLIDMKEDLDADIPKELLKKVREAGEKEMIKLLKKKGF
ncbi:nucleotidyltransferase [Candidatus Woesearchaeota archaeon]|nr:nucleotidyltransferase [Candidatus Woesearchaeota archaeon]